MTQCDRVINVRAEVKLLFQMRRNANASTIHPEPMLNYHKRMNMSEIDFKLPTTHDASETT